MVGSIRQDSYNMKLTQFMQERYNSQLNIEIINIRDLPHYDQDIEHDLPVQVQTFKQQVHDVDAFLLVTPEFNHSIPGVLKNALDWLSRGEREMAGKPVMIAGATMGMLGTVRAQMHLRQILNAPGMGAKVMPGNEILVGAVQGKINEENKLTDPKTIEFIDSVVNQFVVWADKELEFSHQ
nr:NADPH-dependent FMN reductase [Thalassobacillus sp. CUG 92003]